MRLIQPQQGQITIDGWTAQQASGYFDQSLRRFQTIVLHDLNGSPGGKMPPLLVCSAQPQCRDQFTVAFQFGSLQQTRLTVVGAMRACVASGRHAAPGKPLP